MSSPSRVFVSAGQVFGQLTVIVPDAGRVQRSKRRPKGVRAALVQCKCGTEKLVAVGTLVHGETVSCGCSRRRRADDMTAAQWRPDRAEAVAGYAGWRARVVFGWFDSEEEAVTAARRCLEAEHSRNPVGGQRTSW